MARIATIGFFDGVHLGHRFLFAHLKDEAERRGLAPMIVSFDQHPRAVLQMGYQPQLLNSTAERVRRLEAYAPTEIFHFEDIRLLTAEQFMRLLYSEYDVRVLLMGYDHRFGSDRLSDREDYKRVGQQVGMEVLNLEQYELGDEHISSTEVRQALQEADIERANRMLGYDYTLTGTVVHGRGLGHRIGFPTANIALDETRQLLPPKGVYIAEVTLPSGAEHRAILNIGVNPTVGENPISIEVHIPDWTHDLYDMHMSVQLIHYLREERRFDSLDELKQQIAKDLKML